MLIIGSIVSIPGVLVRARDYSSNKLAVESDLERGMRYGLTGACEARDGRGRAAMDGAFASPVRPDLHLFPTTSEKLQVSVDNAIVEP